MSIDIGKLGSRQIPIYVIAVTANYKFVKHVHSQATNLNHDLSQGRSRMR